jgi:hypothetical protein
VRQGASWTAAYHLQLTVAAVARPVRSSVGALGVLAGERSWLLLARTASAHRSVQPVSRGRRRRRGPHCQQARHGVGRRCPAGGVHPSGFGLPGSGCPAARCPVTWGRRPEGPALGRLLSTRPASSRPLSTRPASSRPLSTPVGPDASVSFHLRRWRWGPRSRRPGHGRRCRSRVGQWEVGGGRAAELGAGRGGRACLLSDQAGQAGVRSARRGRLLGGRGCRRQREVAAPAGGCRPRAGYATTVGGRRRA